MFSSSVCFLFEQQSRPERWRELASGTSGLPLWAAASGSGKKGSNDRSGQVAVAVLLLVAAGLCVIGWAGRRPDESAPVVVRYALESPERCDDGADTPFFLALVHSKADHFRQRQVIRQTWASDRRLVRHVFLVGTASPAAFDTMDVQRLVEAEASKYSDVIQGDFVDDYRNLTLKNLMGLRWATERCPKARHLLKSDDDAFVDVDQLKRFIERTWPDGVPGDTIACSVHEDADVQRSGKWAVSKAEYQPDKYPTFCSGLAYVMRAEMAARLSEASGRVATLWVDDVYVTGLLAEHVSARHFYLNLRFTHRHDDVVQWLDSEPPASNPMPFIVSELDTSRPDWRQLAHKLWNRTRQSVYSDDS